MLDTVTSIVLACSSLDSIDFDLNSIDSTNLIVWIQQILVKSLAYYGLDLVDSSQ